MCSICYVSFVVSYHNTRSVLTYINIEGGGKEGKESPVETMNREFQEEMGTFMNFNVAEDYCFSYMEVVNPNDVRLLNIFCRMTSNLVEFNALLINFPSGNKSLN